MDPTSYDADTKILVGFGEGWAQGNDVEKLEVFMSS